MEVRATLRYLRMSPKKVRLIVDMVRGMGAEAAVTQLQFSRKGASHPLEKLLRSALANAKNNFGFEKTDDLYIKHIAVDQGPTLKRWRARAMGRAATIRKRTSHISLVLEEAHGTAQMRKTMPAPQDVSTLPKDKKNSKTHDVAPAHGNFRERTGTTTGKSSVKPKTAPRHTRAHKACSST